jgi:hypothetical protein
MFMILTSVEFTVRVIRNVTCIVRNTMSKIRYNGFRCEKETLENSKKETPAPKTFSPSQFTRHYIVRATIITIYSPILIRTFFVGGSETFNLQAPHRLPGRYIVLLRSYAYMHVSCPVAHICLNPVPRSLENKRWKRLGWAP